MKVSYAITVCNEINEIQKLLLFLFSKRDVNDEVVVVFDSRNGTDEVLNYLESINQSNFKFYKTLFNGDFSCWKNNVKIRCNGDYIFFVDADEIPNEWLISNLKNILQSHLTSDLFILPRVNIVNGHDANDIRKYNWNINQFGWVNFPDNQMRIIKNSKDIFWINKVHEILTGYKQPIVFPPEEKYSIRHEKEIQRQRKQNSFYDEVVKDTSETLNIIYRVCDSVSVTSSHRQVRDFGTKKEIIVKCFESLINAIKNYRSKVNLYIVSDNLSKEIKNIISSSEHVTEFIETIKRGNGNSFAKCVEVGLTCSGMIFFLEDDYFLDENCLNEMVLFRRKLLTSKKFKHSSICVYPLDEDRYDKPELSYVLLGENRHWRTIKQTTCTFMIDDRILKDQIVNLLRYERYGEYGVSEGNTINLMYEKYPCFSPIPSLVDHLQFQDCLPPFSKFKK